MGKNFNSKCNETLNLIIWGHHAVPLIRDILEQIRQTTVKNKQGSRHYPGLGKGREG